MSKTINKVFLLGHVGRDPEIKFAMSGMKIARLSLATSYRTKGPNGDYADNAQWHLCEAFDKIAEVIEKWVKKGSQVCIEGEIRSQKYTDKSGIDKTVTKILIHDLTLLDGKQENQQQPTAQPKPYANQTPVENKIIENFDAALIDDVPF